jgi:signal transduction histidine kinase
MEATESAPGSSRRVIETTDAARRQLARDLHDGAQQQLLICLTYLQRCQHQWSDDPERARQFLDAAVSAAESTLAALRELAGGIHPAILTNLGLSAAIEELAARQPVPVTLEVTDTRFDAPLEASVYFFVSEALSNVVKHASASRAAIRIVVARGRLSMEVRDDGVGGARAGSAGTGLPGLADRVSAFDGKLTMSSSPGDGTILRADIPLGESVVG